MVHVSATANRAYLPHVAAMLHSAISVEGQAPLDVHLLHGADTSVADLAPLAAMLEAHGGRLHAQRIEPARLADLATHRFSITAWYRVLLPELLPDVDRVIHLDGDVLVLGSLCELAETELHGAPFAAVTDPLYPWMRPSWERLGLPLGTPYLNTGVLLLDLRALREDDAVGRLLAYGAAHPDNPWPEQDAFAALFRGQWMPLHPRWNVQTILRELPDRHLPWDRSTIREARRRPVIEHFSGPFKPWDGWGRREAIRAYLHHRREAGHPMPEPTRPALARLPRHTPLGLRRRAIVRALKHRGRP